MYDQHKQIRRQPPFFTCARPPFALRPRGAVADAPPAGHLPGPHHPRYTGESVVAVVVAVVVGVGVVLVVVVVVVVVEVEVEA